MEIKTKAIVIGSKDSGDKDKIVTLFCLEKGIIQAKLKGVKNPKAKLKFAKEPFCFGEFLLVQKGDFFTVASAECIDSFYSLSQNYQAFLVASQILKIILRFPVHQEQNVLFLQTLQSLKVLAYDKVDPNIVFAKFVLGVLYSQGYEFSHTNCTSCSGKLGENRWIDFSTGEVLCASCKTDYCTRISYAQSGLIKIINQTDYNQLASLHLDEFNLANVLDLLKKNLERKLA
jgi:DNA repair protein RecO (recombination protein O)